MFLKQSVNEVTNDECQLTTALVGRQSPQILLACQIQNESNGLSRAFIVTACPSMACIPMHCACNDPNLETFFHQTKKISLATPNGSLKVQFEMSMTRLLRISTSSSFQHPGWSVFQSTRELPWGASKLPMENFCMETGDQRSTPTSMTHECLLLLVSSRFIPSSAEGILLVVLPAAGMDPSNVQALTPANFEFHSEEPVSKITLSLSQITHSLA